MTLPSTPTYYAEAGVWKRYGYPDITPSGIPIPPFGYDWTVNPWGSIYDSRASAYRAAGGYEPDASKTGIPSGVTLTSTITDPSSYFTFGSVGTAKGLCTVSASTDRVTRVAHGLSNGNVVYFTSLTGGAGLSLFSASPHTNWYVVANATADDFQLIKMDPNTGLPSIVDITTSYTAAQLTAAPWYDKTNVTAHLTTTSTAVGIVLMSRSMLRGPATPLGGFNGSSQGMVWNKSPNFVFIFADCEFTPDAPVNQLDAKFGVNIWSFREHVTHVIDGHGSLGGTHIFGGLQEKLAWFYPAPSQTNGSHCDALMQVHSGAVHVARGNVTYGQVDATVSSTTDSSAHPIPVWTTSNVLVGGGSPLPSGLDVQRNHFRYAAEDVNISATNFPNLGNVFANQLHLHDSEKSQYPQGIVAPNTGTATIHVCIPSSGVDANIDENGTIVPAYKPAGSTLVCP